LRQHVQRQDGGTPAPVRRAQIAGQKGNSSSTPSTGATMPSREPPTTGFRKKPCPGIHRGACKGPKTWKPKGGPEPAIRPIDRRAPNLSGKKTIRAPPLPKERGPHNPGEKPGKFGARGGKLLILGGGAPFGGQKTRPFFSAPREKKQSTTQLGCGGGGGAHTRLQGGIKEKRPGLKNRQHFCGGGQGKKNTKKPPGGGGSKNPPPKKRKKQPAETSAPRKNSPRRETNNRAPAGKNTKHRRGERGGNNTRRPRGRRVLDKRSAGENTGGAGAKKNPVGGREADTT